MSEKLTAAETSRNDNAEWAILKELASTSNPQLSIVTELDRPQVERAKYRARGEKLLRVIQRMPDRPTATEKSRNLDQIHRIAKGVGIDADLQEALTRGIDPAFGEQVGKETFASEEIDLSEDELEKVEHLREKVVDMTMAEAGILSGQFPSGTFLFHGSTVKKIEQIFRTGGLKNGAALVEDYPEISAGKLNSGFEGISWSMNAIDALPGTRGHLAGFLAAPEDVLSPDQQLVIPSRPAPYEVLQISDGVNAQEFYALKNQVETWGDGSASFGEKNNVDCNLVWMRAHRPGSALMKSSVYEYEGSLEADDLRKWFSLDEQRKVIWNEDLYQKSEVPPALPYLQSIIDRGFLRNVPEYRDLDTVEKVLARTREDPEFLMRLIATERTESKPINEAYDQALQAVQAVRIQSEAMYFVTSHKDLEAWLAVMARTGVESKGILLYDDNQVVMENFASDYEGNHGELSAEISRTVGADEDFWQREMNMSPTELPRSGSAGQVLLESAVKRDRSLKLVDGQLTVITGPDESEK